MFVIISSVTVALFAAHKLLGVRSIHSWIWTCKSRTNTSRQLRFERLQRYSVAPADRKLSSYRPTSADVITFDFTLSLTNPGSAIVEAPPGSHWECPLHLHLTEGGCNTFKVVKGEWMIGPLVRIPCSDGLPVYTTESLKTWTWLSPRYRLKDTPQSIEVTGSVGARRADHMLCSMVQDAETYFSLDQTPPWVKMAYGIVCLVPKVREWVVTKVLWIQLRAAFRQYDILEYRGRINIPCLMYTPEPIDRFERWSEVAIAKAYLWWNEWLARFIFGMRSRYPEYEPSYGVKEL